MIQSTILKKHHLNLFWNYVVRVMMRQIYAKQRSLLWVTRSLRQGFPNEAEAGESRKMSEEDMQTLPGAQSDDETLDPKLIAAKVPTMKCLIPYGEN